MSPVGTVGLVGSFSFPKSKLIQVQGPAPRGGANLSLPRAVRVRTQACHGPLSPGTSMAAERRRRGPLRWHERHLDHFLDLLLDSFDDASLWLDLREYCHKKQWGFSSGCAGTESPAWILAATRRCLQARGVEFSVFHVASLEIEPERGDGSKTPSKSLRHNSSQMSGMPPTPSLISSSCLASLLQSTQAS